MKLRYISFCCSLFLVSSLCINAMEMTRPSAPREEEQSRSCTPPPFVASDISVLQTLAARNVVNNASSSNQEPEILIVQPSAPQLEDQPPAYEAVNQHVQPEILQSLVLPRAEIGTQTEIISCSETEEATPSSSTQTIPQSIFDQTDNEYQKLFLEAQKNGAQEALLTLINNARDGQTKVVFEIMETIKTNVGSLPLRAAIVGGHVDTIETLLPYNSEQDMLLSKNFAVHNGHLSSLKYLLKNLGSVDFAEKCLEEAIQKNEPESVKAILEIGGIKPSIKHLNIAVKLDGDATDMFDILWNALDRFKDCLLLERKGFYWCIAENPLNLSVKKGELEYVKYFLNKGFNPFCASSKSASTCSEIVIEEAIKASLDGDLSTTPAITKVIKEAAQKHQLKVTERKNHENAEKIALQSQVEKGICLISGRIMKC